LWLETGCADVVDDSLDVNRISPQTPDSLPALRGDDDQIRPLGISMI
jgi:hypothetical protein